MLAAALPVYCTCMTILLRYHLHRGHIQGLRRFCDWPRAFTSSLSLPSLPSVWNAAHVSSPEGTESA